MHKYNTCAALGTDDFRSLLGRLFQKQFPSTWSGQIDQIQELDIIEGEENVKWKVWWLVEGEGGVGNCLSTFTLCCLSLSPASSSNFAGLLCALEADLADFTTYIVLCYLLWLDLRSREWENALCICSSPSLLRPCPREHA